jgi:hypothetical protein
MKLIITVIVLQIGFTIYTYFTKGHESTWLPIYVTVGIYLCSLLGATVALAYLQNKVIATVVMVLAFTVILGNNVGILYHYRRTVATEEGEYDTLYEVLLSWIIIV